MRALKVRALARASVRPRHDVVRLVVGQAGPTAEGADLLLAQHAPAVALVLGAESSLLTGQAAVRWTAWRAGVPVRVAGTGAGRAETREAGGHGTFATLDTMICASWRPSLPLS
jgi:hypothetical protein